MSDCVFCRIVAGVDTAQLVHEWADAVAIVPLLPVVPGHLLVLPATHVVDFAEDPLVTASVSLRAAQVAASLGGEWNLITSKGPAATQTVKHLHLHLVPRTRGDGLALPWTGQSPCYCGHDRADHTDARDEPTSCARCGCLAYH